MSAAIGGGYQSKSTNTSQNVVSTGSSSGATNKLLTPFQQSLQSPLFGLIKNLMTNPGQTIAPLVTQAKNNITSSYRGMQDTLRQNFMSNGGGKSGKYGTATLAGNLAREGDLANADNAGAAEAVQAQQYGAGLAGGMLAQDFGQSYAGKTNGTQDTTGTSDSSGWDISAGIGTKKT